MGFLKHLKGLHIMHADNNNISTKTKNDINKSIGSAIREARIKNGYKPDDIAYRLCITYEHYMHIETGFYSLSIDKAIQLSVLYNISLDELLDINNKEEESTGNHDYNHTPLVISNEDVCHQIRILRLIKGKTQKYISEETGLHLRALSAIEKGNRSPTVNFLIKFANVLKIPHLELFKHFNSRFTKGKMLPK